MTTENFIYGIQYAFIPYYITYSLIKTVFFAFIITSVSAFQGYYVEGGSLEVGRASTKAVVYSSVLILLVQCNSHSTSAVMISVKNLNKSFNGKSVLKDITVTFETGKTNLIIGRSGSGKTVLLKSIVGLHEIDSGEIWFEDTLFNKLDFKDKKKIRSEMGMLFQGSALFDSLTVEQNVRFPLDMFTDKTNEEKEERVNFCLKRVNIINANKLFPAELSGGMKKRVAIARAISLKSQISFL